jgi:hypothetical protein
MSKTWYAGVLFMSQLEAEWAKTFDTYSILWRYESHVFAIDRSRSYTPDFLLSIQGEAVVVEIKPTLKKAENDERIRTLSRQVENECFWFAGYPTAAETTIGVLSSGGAQFDVRPSDLYEFLSRYVSRSV